MKQTAKVLALISDGTAKVLVERMSACGHDCSTCDGCGLQAAPIEAVAKNKVGAKPGDVVTIESCTKRVLSLAAWTYLLPVVLLFLVFFITRSLGINESICSVLSVTGFISGLLCAVSCNRKGQIDAEITEIVTQCTDV